MSTSGPARSDGTPMTARVRRRASLSVALGVAALAAILVAAPVAAGVEPWSLHEGRYGVHTLIDNQEYAEIKCTYDLGDGHLVKVRARRPIAFAYDRNSNVNSQWLRWRVDVRGGAFLAAATTPAGGPPYSHVVYTPWQYDYTSDQVPAEFTARTWYPTSGQRGTYAYFVFVIQIQWLYPYKSSSPPDGKAYHQAAWYEQAGEGIWNWESKGGACYSIHP